MLKRICVYSGSSSGNRPEYIAAARQLGGLIAAQGSELVYGGAAIGLMGEVADAVLSGGGRVTGIIPQAIVELEVEHRNLTELIEVESMHERKALMEKMSDGFVALPGGLGTFEEMFEILCWAQLNFHRKPCGVLNVCGYYDRLLEFLHHSVREGFVKAAHAGMLLSAAEPEKLLAKMEKAEYPEINKL